MIIAQQVTLPPIPHGTTNEKLIVGKLVQDILAAGNTITVNDGEDETLVCSTDAKAIFEALASTDEDYVIVNSNQNGRYGWVRLIWGNDHDIISDYTTNLETLLAGANALADELEG